MVQQLTVAGSNASAAPLFNLNCGFKEILLHISLITDRGAESEEMLLLKKRRQLFLIIIRRRCMKNHDSLVTAQVQGENIAAAEFYACR
ncbi:hypothetical protein EJB05_06964 [Eragrostis curvula]|uniref:Uncharacterized protein n=1 Tax=Eragrostis curvula TaxID=38414 RepID=A0A5J9WHC0_9POAL|nr:hypothetical protein EJB05_06964 [Eragrostis curvula]